MCCDCGIQECCLRECCAKYHFEKKRRVMIARIKHLEALLERVDTKHLVEKRKQKEAFMNKDVEEPALEALDAKLLHEAEDMMVDKAFDFVHDQAKAKLEDLIDVTEFIPVIGNIKCVIGFMMIFFFFFSACGLTFVMLLCQPYMIIAAICLTIAGYEHQNVWGLCYVLQYARDSVFLLFINILLSVCYLFSPLGAVFAGGVVACLDCCCGPKVEPVSFLGTTIFLAVPHSSTLPRVFICCFSSSLQRRIKRYKETVIVCDSHLKRIQEEEAYKLQRKNENKNNFPSPR